MASNHPVDQLFREGLGSSEMKPSTAAWDQIQQRTQKKSKIGYLQIAASIALLCAVGVSLWLVNNENGQEELSYGGETIDITSPNQLAYQPIIIPERDIIIEEVPIKEVPTEKAMPLQPEQNFNTASRYIVMEIPTLDVEARGTEGLIVMTFDIPQLDIEGKSNNKVNIFYYTQATPEERDASKGKLAKIIDYAKTTNPVDWVGDIRNKKDEWIENVFSLDE